MSVQQFCLRWNNHQPNFISVCSSLLHNGTLVDVTLAAEGRQLQAHKIVLSACSSYFQTLFTTNPCQHPIVILKDVQYDDLKTMVDFMYYGEVNVSQEQLPHILKTAEMLKIKGLAEMPTDPANLTKSENKSSNELTELIGSASSTNQGNACGNGGGSGVIGGGTSGSASDSIWESTESQFQQQQHHQQQLQQEQHHHHEQHHHSQQQSSQAQTPQQHALLRRTPSPLEVGASLATRRKRLRKSSNNGEQMEEHKKTGSGERSNTDDQQSSSLDVSNIGTGVSLSQMCQMSFNTNPGTLSGIGSHSLTTAKLLKEASNLEAPQDSDSLDDGRPHVPIQIKPEVDISGVQTIPLDISGATTPSEHDAPNSQSTHSGLQWTVVDTNYSRFSLSSCQPSLIGNSGNQSTNAASSGNITDLQQHQRPQQQQQQESENLAESNQQQHLQQLQHYQQQNTAYTSQIISVNSLVGGYPTSNATQNLSPPSPNIVQTVYSQGTTPMQSPIHSGANICSNGATAMIGNNASNGGTGSNVSNNIISSVNTSNNASTTGGGNSASSQVVKRKRSVNPQGDENFIRALEAVRSGGIGFCKAARLYGVNNRTLWLEYKKRGYPVSRPSIKSRIVKQEPNLSPSPTPPINVSVGDDTTNENFDQIAAAAAVAAAQTVALNMQIPPASESSTSLMCAPHHPNSAAAAVVSSSHPAMGVMSFLDTRHMEFPALHSMSRQRYIDATNTGSAGGSAAGTSSAINVNSATAMNLQSINFNSM